MLLESRDVLESKLYLMHGMLWESRDTLDALNALGIKRHFGYTECFENLTLWIHGML